MSRGTPKYFRGTPGFRGTHFGNHCNKAFFYIYLFKFNNILAFLIVLFFFPILNKKLTRALMNARSNECALFWGADLQYEDLLFFVMWGGKIANKITFIFEVITSLGALCTFWLVVKLTEPSRSAKWRFSGEVGSSRLRQRDKYSQCVAAIFAWLGDERARHISRIQYRHEHSLCCANTFYWSDTFLNIIRVCTYVI